MTSNFPRILTGLLTAAGLVTLTTCGSAAPTSGSFTTQSRVDGWPPQVNTKFSPTNAVAYSGTLTVDVRFAASPSKLRRIGVQSIVVRVFKPTGTAAATAEPPFQDVTDSDFTKENISTNGAVRRRRARYVLRLTSGSYPTPTHLLLKVVYLSKQRSQSGQPSYVTGIVVSKPKRPATAR